MKVVSFYKSMSPFQRVILALILGISTGIIIGEPTGNLEIIGNAYIRLLKMTVLPYVLVSIVGGYAHAVTFTHGIPRLGNRRFFQQ